ncbi:MAG: hypothetical protein AAB401_03760 [Acidobacteriota bacterium]
MKNPLNAIRFTTLRCAEKPAGGFVLPKPVDDIAVGHLDGDWMVVIAIATGERLLLLHVLDRKLSARFGKSETGWPGSN